MPNEVKISVSATDNTAQGADAAEARMKALRAPLLEIQANFQSDTLKAQVDAAAVKARAKVEFDAEMEDASKIKVDADRVAAEAKATINFKSQLDSADLKAKADIAAAAAKAEIKFTETIDPNSRTNLISAMQKDVTALASQAAQDGEEVGSGLMSGVGSGAAGMASPTGIAMGVAVVGAITVAAPLVAGAGAALGAAAIIAAGAAVQHNTPELTSAFGGLVDDVKSELTDASSVMVGPLTSALDSIRGMVQTDKPVIDSLFADASNDIPIFENGIQSLVQGALPGFQNMIKNSGPIVQGLSTVLGDVGQGIGDIAQEVSNDAPDIGKDFEDVGTIVKDTADTIGGLIDVGSKVGKVILPVLDAVITAVGSVTTGFESQSSVLGVAEKAIFDNAVAQNGLVVAADKVNEVFPQMGTALGATSVQLTNTASDADNLKNAVSNLASGMNKSQGDTTDLSNDLSTLQNAATDTKGAVQAFDDVLAALGQHGEQQVNSFVAAATTDLDGIAGSFKGLKGPALDANNGIMQFTESGAKLQSTMQTAQTDIGSVAEAMFKAGDSTDAINAKVTALDQNLESKLMTNLKMTKTQADAVISSFGLWPDQLDTTLKATNDATPTIDQVKAAINSITDKTINLIGNSDNADGAINHVQGQQIPNKFFSMFGNASPALGTLGDLNARPVPNKFFSIFGDTSPAQGAINGLIAGNNGRSITIAVRAVTSVAQSTINSVVGGYKAAGGPVAHNASGGSFLMDGLTMIDEQGPELVRLPNGSTVLPAANTAAMLNSQGGGGIASITIDWGGNTDSAFATAFMQMVRSGKIQIRQSQILAGK